MADFGTFAIPVFVISFIVYIVFVIRKSSSETEVSSRMKIIEKISQYMASTQSLDKALRQVMGEYPLSASAYSEVVKKIDAGQKIEQALLETAEAITDEFYKKALMILANVSKKNDADMLYKSVQSMKETAELNRNISSKSEIGSWTVQFVFAIVIPLMYYFMTNILGFQADALIGGFLMVIVVSTAIFQGVVFKQWVIAIIKIPLLFSMFYIVYYLLAPPFLSGLFGSIV